mmetsp:Transcript_12467/g.21135  ORF Transcript_12467/g.21135 Transcript_12467/m.21135 type:complete len:220 (+) Transcript_12467:458-1117(+)
MSPQVAGPCSGTLITRSGSVTRAPLGPQTLQGGLFALGGTGGRTGAGVTGAAVTSHPQGAASAATPRQKSSGMNPRSPAIWKSPQVVGAWSGMLSITTSGKVILSPVPCPQTLHGGSPGLGGSGAVLGGSVTGTPAGASVVGVAGVHPQVATTPGRKVHSSAVMNPLSPAIEICAHVVRLKSGILSTVLGWVMTNPAPQTSQTGKPGLGGMGATTGAAV